MVEHRFADKISLERSSLGQVPGMAAAGAICLGVVGGGMDAGVPEWEFER